MKDGRTRRRPAEQQFPARHLKTIRVCHAADNISYLGYQIESKQGLLFDGSNPLLGIAA